MINVNKEIALHNIAMCASKSFIESNMSEYLNAKKDGYNMLVSDLTSYYIEAYNTAEKDFQKTNMQ